MSIQYFKKINSIKINEICLKLLTLKLFYYKIQTIVLKYEGCDVN